MPTNLKEAAQRWWAKQDPTKRSSMTKAAVVSALVAVSLFAYYGSGRSKEAKAPVKPINVVDVGNKNIKDDLGVAVEKGLANANARQDDLSSRQDKTEKEMQALSEVMAAFSKAGGVSGSSTSPDFAVPSANQTFQAPPAPGTNGNPNDPKTWEQTPIASAVPGGAAQLQPDPPSYVGGIGSVEGLRPAEADASKKNSRKFLLPVSFMPAKLLVGLKASTVDTAKGDPEPIVLRVQAPAILPNDVKAQLSGCFVVANAFGSLATERIDGRLVSLNCLDLDGKGVIDAKIKGIVTDEDGAKGLAARPVTKMGANMGRMFIAGLFGGAGLALSQSGTTTSVSALGATTTIDPGNVGRVAVGKGLAADANELSKIYADLVKQSGPVLEVAPQKDVNVVITESTYIEIKDL